MKRYRPAMLKPILKSPNRIEIERGMQNIYRSMQMPVTDQHARSETNEEVALHLRPSILLPGGANTL